MGRSFGGGDGGFGGGGRARALRRTLLVVAAIVLIVCFVAAGIATISSFSSSSSETSSLPSYIDDRLIIYTDDSISREQLEEYLVEFGGEIYDDGEFYDALQSVGIYYVALDASYTYEELTEFCERLETCDGIDSASVDWEIELYPSVVE